ncbi:neurofilament heavy polypeptide-like [Ctenocephalides felis]|uniref:neurofilament heavy polypeptide-like n=1 Tax=Ctenocephalides felis TaxID=7515 RepID=UPI000E6E588B|nr:neurofilament heavy polypeptide-like [Ctenocephalides felis]XP_026465605.1 neurofilament heavy polypeptide-like [Ctenocephalides felis]
MYLSKLFLYALVCLSLVCFVYTTPQDEYDEPAEAPKTRINPLLRRANGARAGLPNSKAATTTTTTQAPKEEEEYDDEGVEEGAEEDEEVVTTEAPKKKGIKSGVVRPFRSNDDLLAALKRRREEAKNGKSHHAVDHHEPSESAKEETEAKTPKIAPKANNASNGRRRFTGAKDKAEPSSPAEETKEAEAKVAKPSPRSRFSSRASPKAPAQSEDIAGSESNQQIAVQAKPSRANYRRAARS